MDLARTLNRTYHPTMPKRARLIGVTVLAVACIVISGYRFFNAQRESLRLAAISEQTEIGDAVARSTGFGRIVIDDNGRIVRWNAGATRLLGWSSADMKGQKADCLRPGDESARDGITFESVFSLDKHPWRSFGDIEIKRRDGSRVVVTVSVADTDAPGPRFRVLLLNRSGDVADVAAPAEGI